MKSHNNASLEFAPDGAAWNLIERFDEIWRSLDEQEGADSDLEKGIDVWLECNGEMVGIGTVTITEVSRAGPGSEVVRFVCPHCKQPHESLQFI